MSGKVAEAQHFDQHFTSGRWLTESLSAPVDTFSSAQGDSIIRDPTADLGKLNAIRLQTVILFKLLEYCGPVNVNFNNKNE